MDLIRGQKAKLSALGLNPSLTVGVALNAPMGSSIDFSCFGLYEDGQLRDDRYFIFYNQTRSPEGAMEMLGGSGPYSQSFRMDLGRLPATIRKIVLTVTIDGPAVAQYLDQGTVTLVSGAASATFTFHGRDFDQEKAVILLELYFKDEWRVAAVGQGFNGGLSALLKHFGGTEAGTTTAPPAPTTAPSPAPPTPPRPVAPPPPPPPPAPEPPKVQLGKVTLSKRGEAQKLSLAKGGAQANLIHVNLNWTAQQQKKGFMSGIFGSNSAPDLDLGCMWELVDGSKGVIQALGGRFGSREAPPFILLDKDDRSGAAVDGENLYLHRPDLIRKVVIFAFIYQGSSTFQDVMAVLKVDDGKGSQIVVPLNSADPKLTFCAVVRIDGGQGSLSITKEERYFQDHEWCDKYFGFGFSWQAGSK